LYKEQRVGTQEKKKKGPHPKGKTQEETESRSRQKEKTGDTYTRPLTNVKKKSEENFQRTKGMSQNFGL